MESRFLLCALAALAVSAHAQSESAESLVVRIGQGPVRGFKDAETGVFAFYGIPYATAPTGTDRFKAPRPAPRWLDILNATDDTIICPQAGLDEHLVFVKKVKHENCLIANVYVPNTNEKNLPVVVYVHGGAFQVGYGNLATPKRLVKSNKVIAVTFNYRLGIHGFLCLGTKDIPGNAGMKDQVAALRWVNKNIAAFGGNPDEVTIAGYSAGAASVDLLQLSPSAKGLFKRVIPESGSNLNVFTIQSDPVETAKNYAKVLNFTNISDLDALEQFYKTAPFEMLTLDSFLSEPDSTFRFPPCVERDVGEEMFLVESPMDILRKGNYEKLPMLYGFANMEGLFRVPSFQDFSNKMNSRFSDFLPADLQFANENEKEEVSKIIKEFYFGNNPVDHNTILAYIDYFTDVIFAYGTWKSAILQVKAGNNQIYLYEYSFVENDAPVIPDFPNIRGARHAAQTSAVLDGNAIISSIEDDISEEFRNMKVIMRELWLNFITTGKPVPEGSSLPEWPPVGEDGSPHMSLGQTVELRGPLLQRRMQFLDQIYEKYYRNPVPPSAPSRTKHEL